MPNTLGLVDFAIDWLVMNPVLNLPDSQVKFFGEIIQISEEL